MTKRKRRNHSPSFKVKVAMAALRGDKTVAENAEQYDVHPNQIQDWTKRLMSEAKHVFENGNGHANNDSEQELEKLRAKISELTMEKDFCPKRQDAIDDRTPSALTVNTACRSSVSADC